MFAPLFLSGGGFPCERVRYLLLKTARFITANRLEPLASQSVKLFLTRL